MRCTPHLTKDVMLRICRYLDYPTLVKKMMKLSTSIRLLLPRNSGYANEIRAKIVLDQDKEYHGPRKLLPMYLATHLDITLRLGKGKPIKENIVFLKNLVLMSKGGLKDMADGEIIYVHQDD